MATAKQIAANRKNAQKSTGPRDTTRTRWNAMKHGLASTHTLLPHEDPIEFHQIRAELIDTWQPANAIELMLVDEVAKGHWRMQRAHRFEAALFQCQLRVLKHQHHLSPGPSGLDDEAIAITMLTPDNEAGYRTYYRYDARAHSTFYRAFDRLQKLTAARRRQRPAQPEPPKAHTPELASFGAPPQTAPAAANLISLALLICLLTATALFASGHPHTSKATEKEAFDLSFRTFSTRASSQELRKPTKSSHLDSVFVKMQANYQPITWGHSAGACWLDVALPFSV